MSSLNLNTAKERIKYLIDKEGISKREFCRKTGISNGVLDQLTGLSEDNLNKFLTVYPTINSNWIITGKGNIHIDETQDESLGAKTPITGYYYPNIMDFNGVSQMINGQYEYKTPVSLPNFGSNMCFIDVYGDNMFPKLTSGQIIAIQPIDISSLNYGYMYLVVLQNEHTFIQYVKQGIDKDHVLLVSENNHYESRMCELSEIKHLFIVKGVISKSMI